MLNLSQHLRDQSVLIVDIVTTVEISVAFTVASMYSKNVDVDVFCLL
jgi:hypothetical protein